MVRRNMIAVYRGSGDIRSRSSMESLGTDNVNTVKNQSIQYLVFCIYKVMLYGHRIYLTCESRLRGGIDNHLPVHIFTDGD